MSLLVLGIVLLVVGAVIAYLGRPREDFIYIGGVIIFAAGLILVLIGVLDVANVDAATARSSWSRPA